MKISFHHVYFGDEEVKTVLETLDSNFLSPRGPKLPELGQKCANLVGKKYGWPVSSATAALHLSLIGLDIGPGDRVIVPSYTCSPGVYPVSFQNAETIFVDCELDTYGLDSNCLEDVLKSQKIDAAIPVHLYGSSCRNEVIELLRSYGIPIIEDAAESVGGQYFGSNDLLGAWGDISCWSFRGDKIVTALGIGGCFMTDNEEIYKKMKLASDLGLKNDETMGRYRDLSFGWNYELGNVNAAFCIEQLNRLDVITNLRRKSAALWREALARLDDKPTITLMNDYPGHVYYQMALRFDNLASMEQHDRLGERLVARGVNLIPPFFPMEKQPVYQHMGIDCPNSAYCSRTVFMFPCYPGLTEEQISYMAEVIVSEYKGVLHNDR